MLKAMANREFSAMEKVAVFEMDRHKPGQTSGLMDEISLCVRRFASFAPEAQK